jgi:hypothetical protein
MKLLPLPMPTPPLLLTLLLTGCLPEPRDVPTPPPTDPILARFATGGDGVLDAESGEALVTGLLEDLVVIAAAIALVAEIDEAQTVLDESDDPDESEQALTAAGPATDPAAGPALGTSHHSLTTDAGAWARLTYICPGPDRAIIRDANGKLVLRSVLADFDEEIVLWGEALACQVTSAEGLSTIDADITGVYRRDDEALYVELLGDLRSATGEQSFALDIRSDADGMTLYRPVEGRGSFLIGVDRLEDGRGAVTVRDAGGEWLCTYTEDPLRGTCRRGEEVVQWP